MSYGFRSPVLLCWLAAFAVPVLLKKEFWVKVALKSCSPRVDKAQGPVHGTIPRRPPCGVKALNMQVGGMVSSFQLSKLDVDMGLARAGMRANPVLLQPSAVICGFYIWQCRSADGETGRNPIA